MDWDDAGSERSGDREKTVAYGITPILSLVSLLVALFLALRTSYGINFLQWGFFTVGLFLLAIIFVVHGRMSAPLTLTDRGFKKIHIFGTLAGVVAILSLVVAADLSVSIEDVSSGGPSSITDLWGRTLVREYYLGDYGGALQRRMAADRQFWGTLTARLRHDHACDGMSPLVLDPDTGRYFAEGLSKKYPFDAGLSPTESGCCKPPLSCGFTYVNQTTWTSAAVPGALAMVTTNADCGKWSNDQQTLCFDCDSCKAGVLADIQRIWSKPVLAIGTNAFFAAIFYPCMIRGLLA